MADCGAARVRSLAASTEHEEARRHLVWIIGRDGTADPSDEAERLLRRFGSLGAVLAARRSSLVRVSGEPSVATAVRSFNEAAVHVLRARILDRPVLSCWSQLVDYLRFDMSHRPNESFRVLHLDSRNRLVDDDVVAEGDATCVKASIEGIFLRAAEVGSSSIVLVHNHPSGDPTPSNGDIEATRRIVEAGRAFNVSVLDHLIVGSTRVRSLRRAGLMP